MTAFAPTSFGIIGLVAVVGVLASILGLLMRSTSKGGRRVREGRVIGIVGRKGGGKTLFVMHELLRSLGVRQACQKCSREHGERIIHRGHIATNGTVKLSAEQLPYYHHVTTWDDIVGVDDSGAYFFKLPHATLVAIDEAHLFAPAKQGEQLPEKVRWYLSQCRKGVQEFIWVSQNETRVALGLRVQTDEIGLCTKGYAGAMKVRFWEPEHFRKHGIKPDWTFRYRVTKKVASAYDTYELLMPDDETERHARRAGASGSRQRSADPAPSPADDPELTTIP